MRGRAQNENWNEATVEVGSRGKLGRCIGGSTGRTRGMKFMQHWIILTIGTYTVCASREHLDWHCMSYSANQDVP